MEGDAGIGQVSAWAESIVPYDGPPVIGRIGPRTVAGVPLTTEEVGEARLRELAMVLRLLGITPAPAEGLDPEALRVLAEVADKRPIKLKVVHNHFYAGGDNAGGAQDRGGATDYGSRAGVAGRIHPSMAALATSPEVGTDAPVSSPVAGRIDAPPGELEVAVRLWLERMAARGKSDNTINAYRALLRQFMRETGASTIAALTESTVSDWLAEKKASGKWKKNTTVNRNASAFKSLARFLHRKRDENGERLLPENTVADIEREKDDGGEGARAATLEEARAMVRIRWLREQADGRASKTKGALFRMCHFLAACRIGEPEKWRWKHLCLDDAVPHVWWEPCINKNGKNQRIALAPELVRLLLAYREEMRGAPVYVNRTVIRACDSNDPEAYVFGPVPPPHVWRDDRARLNIPAVDTRGRLFSTHAARKWAVTEMTRRGVPEKTADFLMRHKGKVEARYYDPPLEEQAEAVAKLPKLWPENGGPDLSTPKDCGPNPVDSGGDEPIDYDSETDAHPPVQPVEPPQSRPHIGLAANAPALGGSASLGQQTRAGSSSSAPRVEVGSAISGHEIGISCPISVDPIWLAGILEMTARLLREYGRVESSQPNPSSRSAG